MRLSPQAHIEYHMASTHTTGRAPIQDNLGAGPPWRQNRSIHAISPVSVGMNRPASAFPVVAAPWRRLPIDTR
jgi:hypothetical protein